MKKKRLSTAAIVTGIVVILAVLALIVTLIIHFSSPGDRKDDPQRYVGHALASADADLPLMQSDIDNIFYTIAQDGQVAFYEYTGGELQAVEPTGTVQVAPQCSGVQIPATLYYIQRGDEMTGYGLYHPDATGSAVTLYTYFFFNMRTLPPGYPDEDNTQFLLLMDSDADDLYNPDKTYDESFFVQPFEQEIDLRTDFDRNQFVSQVNRMPGTDGRYWSDFAVFTEDTLACAEDGRALFFSGRKYTDRAERAVDIYRRNGSSGAVLITRYTDVDYLYAYQDSSGIHYMRQTENGFAVYCEGEVIREFQGNYDTDYLRDGNYLLEKSSGRVYSLLTGQEYTLPGAETAQAVIFAVSPSGKRCIVGTMENGDPNRQSMVFGDLENGTCAVKTDALMFSAANTALCFMDEDTYFHNSASTDSGKTYSGKIFSFADVSKNAASENGTGANS